MDTTNRYMRREVAEIRERTSEYDANRDLEHGWSLVSMHTAYDHDSKAFAILYILVKWRHE